MVGCSLCVYYSVFLGLKLRIGKLDWGGAPLVTGRFLCRDA